MHSILYFVSPKALADTLQVYFMISAIICINTTYYVAYSGHMYTCF